MAKLYTDCDRYGEPPAVPVVDAINAGIRDVVRRRWAESGQTWRDFVFGSADHLITVDDFATIERKVLDTGHRFAWSSMLSARDRPEIYAAADRIGHDPDFSFEHAGAVVAAAGPDGREQRGVGDNVVQRPANVVGTAYYIRSSDRVVDLMRNGVPADMIAIIDDSGGTLTAPVLERFTGVLCAGGTVRSHLGILTREYGIPCLMNAKISGIREGDRVELETSAPSRTAESYAAGVDMHARVWKLS